MHCCEPDRSRLTESWGFPAAAVPMTAARAKRENFMFDYLLMIDAKIDQTNL
jgi:hypothetical protein